MEKVTGIGGFFFRSRDPKALAAWYERHFGINPPGPTSWEQEAGATAFQPFPSNTGYFGNPDKQWMINFRVRSLDAMVEQLRKAKIAVEVDPQAYEGIGRFATLKDPEGNPIQLWQPE